MNAESAYLYRERKAEVEELGEQAYKRRVLKHLKLKTVLKVIPWRRPFLACAASLAASISSHRAHITLTSCKIVPCALHKAQHTSLVTQQAKSMIPLQTQAPSTSTGCGLGRRPARRRATARPSRPWPSTR